ncbi:hypothetical protein [Embleya sp. NPDC059237]|uniref:hypothetical protein n=1 Tax=Embleya sp. NPDC059237 TaxID=3346784 RepID=UPI0036865944
MPNLRSVHGAVLTDSIPTHPIPAPSIPAPRAGDPAPAPIPQPVPRPAPRPIPVPVPPVPGHRFRIFKQDPTVADPAVRSVFIPTVVLNGPTDARVSTELPGVTPVARNTTGDFEFDPGTAEFDCAHAFAVVHETVSMYERHNDGAPIPFAWNVGGNIDRLTVFPRAGSGANAFYSRAAKALKFLFFTPQGGTSPVFTCRSLDIVAHETGHSILDGLKPGWLSSGNTPQTGGLHESFGDLTAIFLALSQPDQAEALVALAKADLHARQFLSALAEQFGQALGLPFGLRNADNDLKLSEVGNEVHAISQVFTGGIYDTLADIYAFERIRQARTKDPTIVLIEVADHLCKLLFDAIVAAPATDATYADVVNQMLRLSAERNDPANHRTFLRNRFALREVVVSPTPLDAVLEGHLNLTDPNYTGDGTHEATTVDPANQNSPSLRATQDRSTCCGTMQMPEFQHIDPETLATGGPLTDQDILSHELANLRRAFNK